MSIDTRARAASVAVHEAVSQVSPPGPPAPRQRSGVLALATVAAVLVVLGAFVLVTNRPETGQIPVAAGDGDLPRLIPQTVPEGLALASVLDLPDDLSREDRESSRRHTQWIYGAGPPDDPFREADAAVMMTRTDAPDDVLPDPDEATEAVPLRGTTGVFRPMSEASGVASFLGWAERPDLVVTIQSFSLDRETLIAIAEGIVVADDRAETPTLPRGLGLLAQVEIADGSLTAMGSVARTVSYGGAPIGPELPPSYLGVVVGRGNESHEIAMRWAAGPTAKELEIRGRQALLSRMSFEWGKAITLTYLTLSWVERPGVLAAVSGQGVSEADLIAAAESLDEVSAEEWQRMKDEGRDRQRERHTWPDDPGGREQLVSGDLTDGQGRFRLLTDGSVLCIEVEARNGSDSGLPGRGGSCSPIGDPDRLSVHNSHGFVWGRAPDASVSVRVVLTDGTELASGSGTSSGDVTGGPLEIRWFALELQPDREPVEVIALAEDGTVIAREPVPAREE